MAFIIFIFYYYKNTGHINNYTEYSTCIWKVVLSFKNCIMYCSAAFYINNWQILIFSTYRINIFMININHLVWTESFHKYHSIMILSMKILLTSTTFNWGNILVVLFTFVSYVLTLYIQLHNASTSAKSGMCPKRYNTYSTFFITHILTASFLEMVHRKILVWRKKGKKSIYCIIACIPENYKNATNHCIAITF